MDPDKRLTPTRFKDFSFLPGVNNQGVNEDSGFRVGSINTDESIRKLRYINGVSVVELEKRMRPDKILGINPGMISYHGFIGEHESLIEALVKANRVVSESGYTHKQLADWMDIAVQAKEKRERQFEVNGMSFEVSYHGTVSKGQESPFQNELLENDPEGEGWDGEYEVRNLTTGRSFKFTPPIPRWVRAWGFYEGFDTPFSVNTQGVIDTMTKTDRVYKTREEVVQQLRREYIQQGWSDVIIDHPDIIISAYPHAYRSLRRYSDDLEGEDKFAQLVSDDHFTVITNGHYDPFNRFDTQVVVYSNKDRAVPLINCRDVAIYNIIREEHGDDSSVHVNIIDTQKSETIGTLIARSKPDINGWKIYQRGEMQQVLDMDYLFQFGPATVDTQDDSFELFRNDGTEFLIQRRMGYGLFLYKLDKTTGQKERIALSSDTLSKRFGVTADKDKAIITDIQGISVSDNGEVKGTFVVDEKEYSLIL